MQGLHQLVPILIIPAGQVDHELVAAVAVDRAVGEQFTNHPAGLADALVTGFVAEFIVDQLQAVQVAHHDAEFAGGSVGDQLVQLPLLLRVGMAALHAGQRVAAGDLPHHAQLELAGGGPLVDQPEVADQHVQRQRDQGHHRGDVGTRDAPDAGQLLADQARLDARRAAADVELLDVAHPTAGDLDDGLAQVHQRHEQHQRKQGDPHHDGLAEAPRLVDAQHPPEVHEAQHRPHDEEEVGFPGHGAGGIQVRHQRVQAETDHHDQPHDAQPMLPPVPPVPGQLHRRGRHQPVDQRGPDGGDIHDPADGRAPQEGEDHRQRRDQRDGPAGYAVPVQFAEASGQHVVPAQGVKQAAQGRDIADEAGDDQRQQRQHQQGHARPAHVAVGRIEGRQALQPLQVAPVLDVVQPRAVLPRVGRDRQQRHEDVEQRGGDHRYEQHPVQPRAFEAGLLGGMGDVFEADERPGRYHGDANDLGEGRAARHIALAKLPPTPGKPRHEANDDADGEHEGHADHQLRHDALATGAQQRHQQQRGDGQQRFAQVDIVAEQLVQPPHLEHVAQEVAGEQRDRRGVGPQDRQVGQAQEPGRQEAVVVTQDLAGIAVRAARVRVDVHQIGVVRADDQHDEPAQDHAKGAAQRPGLGQVGVAGDDQGAPADAGAYGKGPRAQRGQISTQPPLCLHTDSPPCG